MKTEFDIMYEPTWHCIVGRGMGGYITHQAKNFIFFHWGEVGILLWRTDSIDPSKNIQFQWLNKKNKLQMYFGLVLNFFQTIWFYKNFFQQFENL